MKKKVQTLLIKNRAKKSIDNFGKIYNIKSKDIYETSLKKVHKRKSGNINDEEDDNNNKIKKNINPSFNSIKSSVYRYISKNLPKNIDKLSELPEDSEYYLTERGDNYLGYRSNKIVLFISKFEAQLLYNYNQHCFVNGTFYKFQNLHIKLLILEYII